MEVRLITEHRSNDPAIGYNRLRGSAGDSRNTMPNIVSHADPPSRALRRPKPVND
jgi:hypothetical protein